MRYVLTACNKSGASVTFSGKTLKKVIAEYDYIYSRKGFKIEIRDYKLHRTITLKKTYR